jgi:hypothetical protein
MDADDQIIQGCNMVINKNINTWGLNKTVNSPQNKQRLYAKIYFLYQLRFIIY